jgi:hypothetical protein
MMRRAAPALKVCPQSDDIDKERMHMYRMDFITGILTIYDGKLTFIIDLFLGI